MKCVAYDLEKILEDDINANLQILLWEMFLGHQVGPTMNSSLDIDVWVFRI
jgi:hypothetical protein